MTKPDPSFADTDAGRMTEDEAAPGLVEQRKAIFEFLRHLMVGDNYLGRSTTTILAG